MAVNYQEIDVNTSADVVIDSRTRYTGIYFKGVGDLGALIMEGSNTGNNLTVTLTNGHKVTLIDYFAKNGAFPVKTIKTDSDTYDLITFVNDHSYRGAKQNIMGGVARAITGSVFDDVIIEGGNQTINAVGGNDTIYASDSNSVLIGGIGTNTMIYDYDDWDNTSFGKDTIQLTKGETLNLNVTYDDDNNDLTASAPIPLHLNRGTGKNINDLIITNDKNADDSITIKNYYAKDTGATVLINGHDYATEIGALNFDNNHITGANFTGSALADFIDASGVGQQYKKPGVKTSLVLNGGAGNDDITGSNYGNIINGGTGNDTIRGGADDDIITGGTGDNEIVYTGQFGTDTINLTKNENLIINLVDYGINLSNINTIGNYISLNKANLEITIQNQGKIILKNFVNTNVVGPNGSVIVKYGNGENDLLDLNNDIVRKIETNDWSSATFTKLTYNGTRLSEAIEIEPSILQNCVINANAGNDSIVSGAGDDTVNGGDGNDTIEGWYGNDKLTGGKGSDKFVFSSGDGVDTITDADNNDKIQIKDVDAADLRYGKNGNNLEIYYDDSYSEANKIIIQNYYSKKAAQRVDELITQDDTISLSNVLNNNQNNPNNKFAITGKGTINGTKGNDNIVGSGSNDVIKAGDGNDVINAKGGDNMLYGGSGNDTYINTNLTNFDTVYDESGADDRINIIGVNKNNLVLRFDLKVDGAGNIIENQSRNMYITKTADFGNAEKGIKVTKQFVNGHSIETVETVDNYTLTLADINQLRENIAGWLHDGGFESVQQIIDSGNETNINNLIAQFQTANWQQAV